jgi:hypothetical protein
MVVLLFAKLLIAIIAIGMLVTGVVVLLDSLDQIQKINDVKRKTDLSEIQKVVEVFRRDYGRYPLTTGSPDYLIMISGPDKDVVVTWGASWIPYVDNLPKDPDSSSRRYVYNTGPDRQIYYIYARLDKES